MISKGWSNCWYYSIKPGLQGALRALLKFCLPSQILPGNHISLGSGSQRQEPWAWLCALTAGGWLFTLLCWQMVPQVPEIDNVLLPKLRMLAWTLQVREYLHRGLHYQHVFKTLQITRERGGFKGSHFIDFRGHCWTGLALIQQTLSREGYTTTWGLRRGVSTQAAQ